MGKIETDTLLFGTITGIILPAFTFLLVYLLKEPDMNMNSFILSFYNLRVLPKLMSLCLLPNLILFFGFMRFDNLRSARGVILSLFILAVPILILKFL